MPLIGVGGVASAADAYAKIRAGACLVQLYTALVFAGPGLVTEIKKGLAELLRRRRLCLDRRSGRGASGALGRPLGTRWRGGGAVLAVSSSAPTAAPSAASAARTSCSNSVCVSQMRTLQRGSRRASADQSALVVPRCVEAQIAKRAPQPLCQGEGIVAVSPIALEQRSDQQFHLDHCSSSNRNKLSNLRAERSPKNSYQNQRPFPDRPAGASPQPLMCGLRWASPAPPDRLPIERVHPEACSVKFGNIQ